jgi:hypothetical protein
MYTQIVFERYGADGQQMAVSRCASDSLLFAQRNPLAEGQLIVLAFGDGGRIVHMPICGRLEIFKEAVNG